MSKESSQWLNTRTLIGFTDERGNAWHYRAEDQGEKSNHYPGAIPLADVEKRLFNWEAELVDVFYENHKGKMAGIPGKAAVMAKDNGDILGLHSDGYEIHQYRDWLLKPTADVLGDDVQISSAGLLSNRAVAWVQIERPATVHTPEGVDFRPFILLSSSLDGSVATQYNDAVTNTVCDNTMAIARTEGAKFTFRQKSTKNSGARLVDAKAALVRLVAVEDEFAQEVKSLCESSVSDRQWDNFLNLAVPMPSDPEKNKRGTTMATDKRDALNTLWVSDERVSPWKGTAWGVLQAMNTYAHHLAIVRNTSGNTDLSQEALRAERNMMRAVKGEWASVDAEALSTLERVWQMA